jgi:hypothetical protein
MGVAASQPQDSRPLYLALLDQETWVEASGIWPFDPFLASCPDVEQYLWRLEEIARRASAAGRTVIFVPVDLANYVLWCRQQGMAPSDIASRLSYVDGPSMSHPMVVHDADLSAWDLGVVHMVSRSEPARQPEQARSGALAVASNIIRKLYKWAGQQPAQYSYSAAAMRFNDGDQRRLWDYFAAALAEPQRPLLFDRDCVAVNGIVSTGADGHRWPRPLEAVLQLAALGSGLFAVQQQAADGTSLRAWELHREQPPAPVVPDVMRRLVRDNVIPAWYTLRQGWPA